MGTEMFHFPTSPPPELYIHPVVTTHNTQRGFPIRTPSDHSSFTNSPRLIADYRVLHRLLMPRHPPCALEHSPPHTNTHKPQKKPTCAVRVTRRITQETQNQTKSQQPHTQCDCQMLASTIQKNKQPPHTRTTTPNIRGPRSMAVKRQQPHTPKERVGLFSHNPTACLPTPTHHRRALHPRAPHSSTQVQKFRSVPPMSTPHTHHGCQGLPQHTPQPTTHNVTVNLFGVFVCVAP